MCAIEVGAALLAFFCTTAQTAEFLRPYSFQYWRNHDLCEHAHPVGNSVCSSSKHCAARDTAEAIVPVPNRPAAPLVLGAGQDFDVAAVRAIAFLGDHDPEFAKRSAIYREWAI